MHKCSAHARARLSTRCMLKNMSNMQVIRVHAGKIVTGKYFNLSVLAPYGLPVILITSVLVYPLAITIIMRFTSQFAILEKVTPQLVQLLV